MANIHGALTARGIQYRLRRWRWARKQRAAGEAVFLLDYDVQLSPEDSREQ